MSTVDDFVLNLEGKKKKNHEILMKDARLLYFLPVVYKREK